MERLTAYDSDDFAYVKGGKVMDKKVSAAILRLAAYEDSSLMPDEIQQLLTLTVKLLLLCEVPQAERDKVFRRLHIGAGDYMGSGFAFVDAYHRIYDGFIETTGDGLYQAIKGEIDRQQFPAAPKEEK